jgi:hypothetical protein
MNIQRWLTLSIAVSLLAVAAIALGLPGSGVSVPIGDAETKAKAFVFPIGKYVLGGGPRAATGMDIYQFKKPFTLRQNQYILSGGPNPADRIFVDDDLEVMVGQEFLFVDDDHVASSEFRRGLNCTYDGTPIILVIDPKNKLQIRAIDHCPSEAGLGELYLHRYDGARKRLTEKIAENSNPNLPHIFFDKEFSLEEGWEKPTSQKDALELPASPAALLQHGNH